MATREELLAEGYRRGILPEDVKVKYEEAMRRGLVSSPEGVDPQALTLAQEAKAAEDATGFAPMPQGPQSTAAMLERGEMPGEVAPDEPGFLDLILNIAEPAATLATGAIAEPISGYAGMAGTLLPGDVGQGARWTEATQEALTYDPMTEAGQAGMQALGSVVAPVAGVVEPVVEAVGEAGYRLGGPAGGAGAKTLLAAIPELLGLKGSRLAKKALLSRAVKGKDITGLYDELGQLMPEIKQGLDKAGITAEEISDVLPTQITEAQIKTTAQQVGEAATAKVRPEAQAAKLAEEAQPNKEILEAVEELGITDQPLASHTSQNPTFIAVEQGLKSIPGSQLANKEKVFISSLAQKADDLIAEYGGTIDKSALSDEFRSSSKNIITDLEEAAGDAYTAVREAIPHGLQVSANSTVDLLMRNAADLGGVKYLDAKQKKLLNNLKTEANPTYARLDTYRKQIGEAIGKNSGPFKDADSGAMKQLYKSLAEDQNLVAEAQGVGDLYKTASDLVVSRKTMEKQLANALGKDLSGSITAKGRPAMLALQTGNTKQFDDLMANIPEQLGAEIKKSVAVTALNDAFVQGSRMERQLNIAGFDDFMTGLNRNKAAKSRLAGSIGDEAMNRLELMHKVAGGVRKAQQSAITTGRISAVPGMFDEVDGLASRLFGTFKKVAAAEGATTAMGIPGAGTTGVLASALTSPKTARSTMSDQLLASSKFQNLLKQKAAGTLDTQAKIERADKALEKLKTYQKWKDSLDEKTKMDIAAVGAMGYLTGETIGDETNVQ